MLLIASPVSASGTDGWSQPEVSATVPTRTQQPQWLSALSAPDGTDAVLWYEPIDSSTTQDNLYVAMRPSGADDWTLLDPVLVPSNYLSFLAVTPSSKFWIDIGGSGYMERVTPNGFGEKLMPGPGGRPANGDITIGEDGSRYVQSTQAPTAAGDPWSIAIAIQHPGTPWQEYSLPVGADKPEVYQLSSNAHGDVAVVFLDRSDFTTASMQVATLSHQPGAVWEVTTLAQDGDARPPMVSVGDDGTAAVAWDTVNSDPGMMQLATHRIGDNGGWATYQVASANPDISHVPRPLVGASGDVTVLWEDWQPVQGQAGDVPLVFARYLHDGVWAQAPTQISDANDPAALSDAALLADGRVAVLAFSGTEYDNHAESITLQDGTPQSVDVIDQGPSTWSYPGFGIDGAGDQTVTWFRQGPFGGGPSSLSSATNGTVPTPMTAPYNGTPLTHASLTGKARIGHHLTCRSGYWVEAAQVTYHWYRDGNPLHRTNGDQHQVHRADRGHLITCRVTGTNSHGQTLLDSNARTIH